MVLNVAVDDIRQLVRVPLFLVQNNLINLRQ